MRYSSVDVSLPIPCALAGYTLARQVSALRNCPPTTVGPIDGSGASYLQMQGPIQYRASSGVIVNFSLAREVFALTQFAAYAYSAVVIVIVNVFVAKEPE